MTERGFKIFLALLALAILLASPAGPGAVIGLLLLIIFGALIALVTSALQSHGIPVTVLGVFIGLCVSYASMIVAIGFAAWRMRAHGHDKAGRLFAAAAVLLVTLPLIGYLFAYAWDRNLH